MQLLSLNGINKAYGACEVLKDISFDIGQGSFVSLFGSNAAGKTTLLNIIAGLVPADSGMLISRDALSKDKISYVFQNYRETLFPWKNILENISLPLKLKGVDERERRNKVSELMERFSIDIDLEKYPYQLSGGQQQLVGILRAIITEPALLLLDEPFSALDLKRRWGLQKTVLEIWEQLKITIVFVSHDIDEAIYMADNVILLGGRPAVVERNLKIEIERPRNPKHLTSDEFFMYKKQLLMEFIGDNLA